MIGDLASAGEMQVEALDTSLREGVEALAVGDQTVGEESSGDAGKDERMKTGEATTSSDEKTNNGAVCRVR